MRKQSGDSILPSWKGIISKIIPQSKTSKKTNIGWFLVSRRVVTGSQLLFFNLTILSLKHDSPTKKHPENNVVEFTIQQFPNIPENYRNTHRFGTTIMYVKPFIDTNNKLRTTKKTCLTAKNPAFFVHLITFQDSDQRIDGTCSDPLVASASDVGTKGSTQQDRGRNQQCGVPPY